MKQFNVVALGLRLLLTCRCDPFLHFGPPVAIAPNTASPSNLTRPPRSSSLSNLAVAMPTPTQSRLPCAVLMLEQFRSY